MQMTSFIMTGVLKRREAQATDTNTGRKQPLQAKERGVRRNQPFDFDTFILDSEPPEL